MRALEAWSCPTCAASGLWAIVEVCDGVLTSVSAAALDGATLDAIDIVSGEVLALIPLSEIQTVPRLAPDALRARLAQAERDRGGDAR